MKKIVVLMVMVLAGISSLAEGDVINSNSTIVDDIEYYVQTDKEIYNLGEDVEMLYRVTNLSEKEVSFGFPQYDVYNFWVDKDGDNIWRAVNSWLWVATEFTLSHNESKEFPTSIPYQIWDMRNSEGNLVNLGQYDIIGGLFSTSGGYEYTEVSAPITIVPEPATILIFGTGIIGIRASKRKF